MRRLFPMLSALLLAVPVLVRTVDGDDGIPDKLYVSRTEADIRGAPESDAITLATVTRFTVLTPIEKTGRYWHVRLDREEGSVEGFIFFTYVSEEEPEEERWGENRWTGSLTARGADAAGTRGMGKFAEQYAGQHEIPQEVRDDVDFVNALGIDLESLDRFLREGKLGEYAP